MSDFIFPQPEVNCDGSASKGTHRGGLTKREYFAAMAMQGLLAAVYSSKEMLHDFTSDNSPGSFRKYVTGQTAITRNALSYADALIKALEAKGGDR